MKKMALLTVCVLIAASLMGCETVKGLGQDIQNTGDNVWDLITNK